MEINLMSMSEKVANPAKEAVLDELLAEKQELLELSRQLSQEEWERPSLCEGWRVRDVVAHIIGIQTDWKAYLTSTSGDKANQKMVEARRQLALDKLLEQLSAILQPNWLVRLSSLGYLYDTWVHQQDIRWVLGPARQRSQNPARLRLILDYVAKGIHKKKKGLQFVATDLGWQAGEGQRVSGPAEAIIMALANRPAAVARLSGPGVETLKVGWQLKK